MISEQAKSTKQASAINFTTAACSASTSGCGGSDSHGWDICSDIKPASATARRQSRMPSSMAWWPLGVRVRAAERRRWRRDQRRFQSGARPTRESDAEFSEKRWARAYLDVDHHADNQDHAEQRGEQHEAVLELHRRAEQFFQRCWLCGLRCRSWARASRTTTVWRACRRWAGTRGLDGREVSRRVFVRV